MKHTFAAFFDGFKKINFILSTKQKIYWLILIFMSFIGALLETVGVGIILPFVQILLNIDQVMENKWVVFLSKIITINSKKEVIVIMTLVVILVFIIKNLFFMLLSWMRVKYSCKIQRELSYSMLQNVMKRGYLYFTKSNTTEIIRDISTDTTALNDLLYQIMRATADIFVILLIGIFIVMTDWVIAIGIGIMGVACLILMFGLFQNSMRTSGKAYNFYAMKSNQYLIQAIQGVKEVLVMNRQSFFSDKYKETLQNSQKGRIRQTLGMEYPAYIIETFCVVGLLLTVCLKIIKNGNISSELIPVLSVFAIGAFRILPSLGRISAATNIIIYYMPSLDHVYDNYKKTHELQEAYSLIKDKDIKEFNQFILLKDICWKYNDKQKYILNNLNIEIYKGQSIAFIGVSGSGKTTLADIILGLITPINGKMYLDNEDITDGRYDLSKIMGYVPQTSYLMDDSIKNNIAFGVDYKEINEDKVWRALEQAKLIDYVKSLPDGLETEVGDRGIRFSGGQRQRIAIARALYNDPEILIFDEATAALDNETEKAVMESIELLQGQKTLIIIAHRLTTIKNCDVIYEINNGKAVKKKYEEL